MKKLTFLIAAFVCGMAAFGQTSAPEKLPINWSLLWTGQWDESTSDSLFNVPLEGTLHNRGEMKLHWIPLGLTLRAQVLDRRKMDFEYPPPWNDPDKTISHFMGGLYHKQTGSRLLFGVLDEWGLSARIRNPWIRSPPYTENHKPLMADLKTAASSTKEDEAYLYLSTPYLLLKPDTKLRGFVSAQTSDFWSESKSLQDVNPAFGGGLDIIIAKKTNLLLETFYTGKTLPVTKVNTWFSNPQPLPEREFHLYAAGFLFSNPAFSISSDLAYSETFAWGEDIYGNLGITLTPLLPFGYRARPVAISMAVDGSGERFVNRDGVNLSEGFRGAAKIEWKARYNSLLRVNSVLRGNGLGEEFNRSSTGFYYRFPAVPASRINNVFPIRLTRISLSADRNAVNPLKINDSYSGTIGLNINLNQIKIKDPLGIAFSGTIKGLTETNNNPSLYPISVFINNDETWEKNSTAVNCELFWSPLKFQFRSRVGLTTFVENEDKWDFSFSTAIRFKQGRLSLKAASPDFPDKWYWTISWRLEKN